MSGLSGIGRASRLYKFLYRQDKRGRDLQREVRGRGVPLTIHVERFNPALRLYERLGFEAIEDKGVYLFLEWTALGKRKKGEGKTEKG